MNKSDLLSVLSGVAEEEPIWFWITTKEEMLERLRWNHAEAKEDLTDKEYAKMIAMLEIDDGVVQTIFEAEDYLLNKIAENRKNKTEGEK
jgi:hypothetical protein